MCATERHERHERGEGPDGSCRLVPQLAVQAGRATTRAVDALAAPEDPAWPLVASRTEDGRLSGSVGVPRAAEVTEAIRPHRGLPTAPTVRARQGQLEGPSLLPRP